MKLIEKIGRRVRVLRKAKGMTQDDLSQVINISRPQLSNFESGKVGTGVDTLELIANALGIDMATLFVFSEVADDTIKQRQIAAYEYKLTLINFRAEKLNKKKLYYEGLIASLKSNQ